jgi:hypothetical protein
MVGNCLREDSRHQRQCDCKGCECHRYARRALPQTAVATHTEP